MQRQYLALPNRNDATSPQASDAALYGYQFQNECDIQVAGYRTVTEISLRRLGATDIARGLQRFDRRLRCRTASNSFLPWASLLLLPLAVSRKSQRQYTLSRSRLSQYTQASTSNIVAGQTSPSAPNFPITALKKGVCQSPRFEIHLRPTGNFRRRSRIYPVSSGGNHLSKRSFICPTVSRSLPHWGLLPSWPLAVSRKSHLSTLTRQPSRSIRQWANTSKFRAGRANTSAPRYHPQPEGCV